MRRTTILAGAMALFSAGLALANGTPLYVKDSMQIGIVGATTEIWDIGNNAMGDDGGIDPKLMDDAKWARLETGAGKLAAEARRMATAEALAAARPEDLTRIEPGTYSMEDVQRYIDADPVAYRELSNNLASYADAIGEAAKARDAAQASELVNGLDAVCEACHAKYWYPQG